MVYPSIIIFVLYNIVLVLYYTTTLWSVEERNATEKKKNGLSRNVCVFFFLLLQHTDAYLETQLEPGRGKFLARLEEVRPAWCRWETTVMTGGGGGGGGSVIALFSHCSLLHLMGGLIWWW